jgi:hypothetical protein
LKRTKKKETKNGSGFFARALEKKAKLNFASKRKIFKAKPAHSNSQIHIRILFQVLQRLYYKISICFYCFTVLPVHTGCFIFLVSLIGVRIFSISYSGLKFSVIKVFLNSLAFYLVEMDSDLDPDRQCRSGSGKMIPIRLEYSNLGYRNTELIGAIYLFQDSFIGPLQNQYFGLVSR